MYWRDSIWQTEKTKNIQMKYSQLIGILAGLILIAACFLPWAYYPDIDKVFTGFFSEKNSYGKPGMLLILFSVLSMLLFWVPRLWAKRLNLAWTAVLTAYCFRNFIRYSGCYAGYCPDKKIGLYLIVVCSTMMLVSSTLPDIKLRNKI
jgi:hypothetical protein